MAQSGRLAAGEFVGPYRVEALLGEGGMGSVYRARRDGTGEAVALKVARPELVATEHDLRRLRREARAAAAVQHPNLVALVDAGEHDGRAYLVMRYVAGQTLADRLAEPPAMTPGEIVRVVRQIAGGLDALHQAGVVHRDVKPSNILLDEERRALLTDFGLARATDYSRVTEPGQMIGSVHYLAPELIRGDEPSPAADVYALACVAFEMTAGWPPFGSGGALEVAFGHLERRPEDPCAARLDLSDSFGEAILMGLEKDPDRRPPTPTSYARLIGVAASG